MLHAVALRIVGSIAFAVWALVSSAFAAISDLRVEQTLTLVVEEQNTSTQERAAMNLWTTASLEQLTQRPPVNLFQISVEAGSEKVFANFERAVGTVRPNRMVRPFRMGVVDRDGTFLVSDFWGACVWRYSPDWAILAKYPKDHTVGEGFEPDECEAAGADSRGNVFAMNSSGIFRYHSNGEPGPWPVQSNYTRYKDFGHVLGRTGPNSDERFRGFAIVEQHAFGVRANGGKCDGVVAHPADRSRSPPIRQ